MTFFTIIHAYIQKPFVFHNHNEFISKKQQQYFYLYLMYADFLSPKDLSF
jgi:hypothetical protein